MWELFRLLGKYSIKLRQYKLLQKNLYQGPVLTQILVKNCYEEIFVESGFHTWKRINLLLLVQYINNQNSHASRLSGDWQTDNIHKHLAVHGIHSMSLRAVSRLKPAVLSATELGVSVSKRVSIGVQSMQKRTLVKINPGYWVYRIKNRIPVLTRISGRKRRTALCYVPILYGTSCSDWTLHVLCDLPRFPSLHPESLTGAIQTPNPSFPASGDIKPHYSPPQNK